MRHRTTQQMLEAPRDAVFVWCNSRIDYPLRLAHHLGRTDLRIRPMSWLRFEKVAGRMFTAVIVDHAARLWPVRTEEVQAIEHYLTKVGIPFTRN